MATVKSGYLQKLSGLLKRDWKRRYFVLYQDGELVYYENPNLQLPDGKVNVKQNCQRIDYGYEVEHDLQQRASGRVDCLFTIRSSVKNITVLADTVQDARDWVQKLNELRQGGMPPGHFGVPGMYQPVNVYSTHQPGNPYPSNQPGMVSYPSNQPLYPTTSPGAPYPFPPQSGMPQAYPMGTAYPGQPQPYIPQPQSQMYSQYPNYQVPPPRYGYPAYQQQQQQYYQAPQSRGNMSSRRGLLAGAAGGALAGGLLGFGMGHAVGGMGDSFDCDFDCD